MSTCTYKEQVDRNKTAMLFVSVHNTRDGCFALWCTHIKNKSISEQNVNVISRRHTNRNEPIYIVIHCIKTSSTWIVCDSLTCMTYIINSLTRSDYPRLVTSRMTRLTRHIHLGQASCFMLFLSQTNGAWLSMWCRPRKRRKPGGPSSRHKLGPSLFAGG